MFLYFAQYDFIVALADNLFVHGIDKFIHTISSTIICRHGHGRHVPIAVVPTKFAVVV
jgi:hypothetical protein